MRVLDKFSMEIRNEMNVPTCHVITPPAGFSEMLLISVELNSSLTPFLVFCLRQACRYSHRIHITIAGICRGGGFAYNNFGHGNSTSSNLEDGCIWPRLG